MLSHRGEQRDIYNRLLDLVADAYESRDEVIDSFRDSTVPLSDAEKEAMHRGQFRSGVETDDADIDDILYG